jgi:hypothetical protein
MQINNEYGCLKKQQQYEFICNVCGHSVIAQLDVSDYVSWMKCITQIGALDTNVCD